MDQSAFVPCGECGGLGCVPSVRREVTPVEMGGCRPTRPVPVDEAGTFLVRHLTLKGERFGLPGV